jgi:hypothetical protein
MSAMVVILFIVAIVVLFDLAAIGWGIDSSDSASDPRDPPRPSI